MAIKKAATVKKSVGKKPSAPKAPVKKTSLKGQVLECKVCGLAVTVDTECGCVETCDIICCGKPMKVKKPAVRAKVSAKK